MSTITERIIELKHDMGEANTDELAETNAALETAVSIILDMARQIAALEIRVSNLS